MCLTCVCKPNGTICITFFTYGEYDSNMNWNVLNYGVQHPAPSVNTANKKY